MRLTVVGNGLAPFRVKPYGALARQIGVQSASTITSTLPRYLARRLNCHCETFARNYSVEHKAIIWQRSRQSKFSCHCEERSNLRCLHKGDFAVHKLFAHSALQRIAFDYIPQTVWFAKSLDCLQNSTLRVTTEVCNDRSKEVRKTQRARIIVTTIKASKWAN